MASSTFSGPVTSTNGFIGNLTGTVNGAAAIVAGTATLALTAAQSGSFVTLDALAGFATTLPAVAAGLRFVFVVKTAPTSNGYTLNTASGNTLFGTHSVTATGGGTAIAAAHIITLVANSAVVGDRVSVESDGTNWYVSAVSTLKNSVTSA